MRAPWGGARVGVVCCLAIAPQQAGARAGRGVLPLPLALAKEKEGGREGGREREREGRGATLGCNPGERKRENEPFWLKPRVVQETGDAHCPFFSSSSPLALLNRSVNPGAFPFLPALPGEGSGTGTCGTTHPCGKASLRAPFYRWRTSWHLSLSNALHPGHFRGRN